MIEDGANSNPLIAVVCFFGYIIISCIIAWLICFITASREGRKPDYPVSDAMLCPMFVIMLPFAVMWMLWMILREHSIFRRAAGVLSRTADILTLPFRPTELGMRLYIRREIRKSTKLKKEGKNDEQ